jgi:hypothetical protein
MPAKPGNLTMGWDVPEEHAEPAQRVTPSQLAAKAAGPQVPQKPGALTMGWEVPAEPAKPAQPRAPQQPGALTMGWEVPPEEPAPAQQAKAPQQPGALTLGWEIPEEPAQSQAISPSQLAARAKPEPSAKATLLGIAPIRDEPKFSATQRAAQPIPAVEAPSTVEIAPILHEPQQTSQAGPHQAISAQEPSKYAPQSTQSPAYSPVPASQPRVSTNTEGLDKPPRNMLPIYAIIGLVVVAGIVVAIILLTQ